MVPEREDSRLQADTVDLRDSDREVLELLRSEPATAIGFQGLRRRLRIHPERLSRALHRLAEDDLVIRTDLGYRVTPRAETILSPQVLDRHPNTMPVLQTYLPADVDLRGLARALRGTWIGPLRWYGLTETLGDLQMSWVTEDDSIQLDAHLRSGQLTIAASVGSADRLDEAARLGHLLFQGIVREIAGEGVSGVSA
ncbi:MAG TPA: hypothetical protein VJ326_08585 [Thermoplasmata archaeon]|nr:hypothetical protein [Thermoplasmata archaeon]